MQLLSVFLIGIALSMDTFSLSLSLGTLIDYKSIFKLSFIVGIMHFIMPFLGSLIGNKIIVFLEISCDFLMGIILAFIGIQMLIDILQKEESNFQLSTLGMFLFALGVSLDSFSIGFGINAITTNKYLAMMIFALCSFSFTFLGVSLGKFASKILGSIANVIGAIILIVLGIIHVL